MSRRARAHDPLAHFHFVEIKPVWRSPADNHVIRAALDFDARHAFRLACQRHVRRAGWSSYWVQQLPDWEVHHIWPISLGGSNSTLSLVSPHLHQLIHHEIDGQIPEARRSGRLYIPVMDGPVWAS